MDKLQPLLGIHAQHFALCDVVKRCLVRISQYHPLLGQEEELSPGQLTPGAGAEMDEKGGCCLDVFYPL